MMRININDNIFDVKVADTPSKLSKGLKGIKKLPKDAALLLDFKSVVKPIITMEDVLIPLDLVFILDSTVIGIDSMDIGDEDASFDIKVDSILELNKGIASDEWIGSNVELLGTKNNDGTITPAEKITVGKLGILDVNGKVVKEINGTEKVFSRKHTEQLYNLCQKVKYNPSESNLLSIGKAVIRILDLHSTQPVEHAPN